MADERELIAKLRLQYDQQAAAQAKAGVEGVKKSAEGVGASAKGASTALKGMGEAMKGMGEAMKIAGLAGSAALGAAGLMINKYQTAAGLGESTSLQWAVANHKIEMSMVSIGRSIEQQVLPYLQQAAGLSKNIADFVSKNPKVVESGLKIATGATAVGGVAALLTKVLGPVWGPLVMGGALIQAAPGLASMALVNKIAPGVFPAEKQLVAGFAGGIGTLLGGKDAGNAAFIQMSKFLGLIQDTGSAAASADGTLGDLPEKMQVYTQYLRQEAQAEQERGIVVQRATRDFTRQQLVAEQDYGIQRGRQLRDFNYQQLVEEQDYYRQRVIGARDFGIEMQRTEEDHQRQMQRTQEDYQYGLWDVLRSGDALAYMRAQRDYNVSRSRTEEDYQISIQRRNQDYALSLQDQEQNFQIQRNRQLVEFARQQSDQAADYQRQRKLALQQFNITQADQQQDYDRQKALRRQAFNDQLRDLGGFWTNMADTTHYFTAAMIADYQAMLAGAMTGSDLTTAPSVDGIHRASGGEMYPGMSYIVGEHTGAPEVIRMGANSATVYNPNYPGSHSSGGSSGGKFEFVFTMDGDNWTPTLRARVQAEIIDVVSGALNS